jgi:hypothetical protein
MESGDFRKYRKNWGIFWMIRKYTNGAKLMPHLDHMETHVISAILNIAQQVQPTILNSSSVQNSSMGDLVTH